MSEFPKEAWVYVKRLWLLLLMIRLCLSPPSPLPPHNTSNQDSSLPGVSTLIRTVAYLCGFQCELVLPWMKLAFHHCSHGQASPEVGHIDDWLAGWLWNHLVCTHGTVQKLFWQVCKNAVNKECFQKYKLWLKALIIYFSSINKMRWMNKWEIKIKSLFGVTNICLQNRINSSRYTCK